MGKCKRCGGIYGAHEMTEGICKNCLTDEDKENIKPINKRERSTTSWFIIFSLVTLFLLFVLFVIVFLKNFHGM